MSRIIFGPVYFRVPDFIMSPGPRPGFPRPGLWDPWDPVSDSDPCFHILPEINFHFFEHFIFLQLSFLLRNLHAGIRVYEKLSSS